MKSTSIHRLNADRKLSRFQQIFWFLYNWLNNITPNFYRHYFKTYHFRADILETDWCKLGTKTSPSRRLSNLFWLRLPWEAIQSELGTINVVDTGCGSGNYGAKLRAYSGDRIASYTGLDAFSHDNWISQTNENPTFKFHRSDSTKIFNWVSREDNFFISQSAIEHFEDDVVYFEQLRDHICRSRKPTIQIHLFPSSACLKLYSLHGIRQYTPRTISIIAAIFDKFSYSVLYSLGGRECNLVHWEFITKPLYIFRTGDFRETKTDEYDQRLRNAIRADMSTPCKSPSFYALVIHSHAIRTLFTDTWTI